MEIELHVKDYQHRIKKNFMRLINNEKKLIKHMLLIYFSRDYLLPYVH